MKAKTDHKLLQTISKYYQGWRSRHNFKKSLRPTDIFIVGHPKSGNTWLTLMLANLIHKNFDKNVNLSNIGEFIPSFHARDLEIRNYRHFPDPRIFRNEGPLYPELYPKTVYIIRDPRSVYVSYYHHCVHDTQEHDWLMEAYIDEMINYGCIKRLEPHLIRWDRQVLQWMERSKNQPVKIIKYEDMKNDRRKVLEDVVDFAEIICSKEEIDIAVEKGSFNSMRNEEVTYGAAPYSGDKGEKGYFVRRGKINGWKDELSPDLAKRIEIEFSEVMKKLGYL